jgi:hypothetical protein
VVALEFTEVTATSDALDLVSTGARLAFSIILLIHSFKVRRILEAHLQEASSELADYPHLRHSESALSGLAVFFLHIFYLQHVINKRLVPLKQIEPA